METYLTLITFLCALVASSLQYDDRISSLKDAAYARLASRNRDKVNLNGEYTSRSGNRIKISIQGDRSEGGGGLRLSGEYFGRNGGSLQGSIRRDARNTADFFRGVDRRRDLDAAFEARLPSGAGIGGRAKLGRRLKAGITGVSGGYRGQFEGGFNDAFGNGLSGGFQGGIQGRAGLPVVAAGYVQTPYNRRHVVVG